MQGITHDRMHYIILDIGLSSDLPSQAIDWVHHSSLYSVQYFNIQYPHYLLHLLPLLSCFRLLSLISATATSPVEHTHVFRLALPFHVHAVSGSSLITLAGTVDQLRSSSARPPLTTSHCCQICFRMRLGIAWFSSS